MTDVFNVTAAWDKTAYSSGDTMTATISGGDVVTTTSDILAGPIMVPLVNPKSNATTTITVPAVVVHVTNVSTDSVIIDTSKPIIDSSTTPRTWTPTADLLSITATA